MARGRKTETTRVTSTRKNFLKKKEIEYQKGEKAS